MKKLLLIVFLVPFLSYGQISVKGTNGTIYTLLTQAQTTKAISDAVAIVVKNQAQVDAVQNTRLAVVEKGDTTFYDKRYFTIVGKNIYFNVDSAAKYMKIPAPVVDLTTVTTKLSSLENRTTAVEVRATSLEQWRTSAITSLDAINTKIASLPAIPTKAVSTSVSTTTTTTTTTLQ